MPKPLKDLKLGMVDGKFEYVVPKDEQDQRFYDAFLIPENVDTDSFNNRATYFVEGFRGTGKTSLLRWISEQKRKSGYSTEFTLFKSDLPEDRRVDLSSQVGVTWLETDKNTMEFSQDFKTSWEWFIFHKLGEVLLRHPTAFAANEYADFIRLLGLKSSVFQKVMGFLPKLEKLNVEIGADLDFFEAKLGT